jgi:hypothetical protein
LDDRVYCGDGIMWLEKEEYNKLSRLEKISFRLSGREFSEEHRKNIGKSSKGRIPHNKGKKKENYEPIQRAARNSSISLNKLYASEEGIDLKKRIGAKSKLKVYDAEYRKKIGDGNRGKHHTDETKKKMSKTMRERWDDGRIVSWQVGKNKYNYEPFKQRSEEWKENYITGKWKIPKHKKNFKGYKSGYDEYLGHYVRSSWELNTCTILKDNNIEYSYEPEAFLIYIDGVKETYTPDIYLIKENLYIELKGGWVYNDSKSMKKFYAFKEQYKDKEILLIEGENYIFIERSKESLLKMINDRKVFV